jgi:diacylglycerol O-acyltransferase
MVVGNSGRGWEMESINFVDQGFYLNETRMRPMHIGALLELAPPAKFSGDLLQFIVDSMLEQPVGAPFNYRLRLGPGGIPLGYDVDENVDPASRMRFHTLPAPGDRRTLLNEACRIHEKPLDRSEPLWELHMLDGLSNGHVGLFMKVHHGLIDGIGFIKRFRSVVSELPGDLSPHALWEAAAWPERRAIRRPGNLLGRLAGRSMHAMVETSGNVLGAGAMAARMLMRSAGAGNGMTIPFANTAETLKSKPSQHRTLGYCVLDLPGTRRVAKLGQGKVNDVLLTTLDMAVGRYATEKGKAPDRPLVAIMPVALDTASDAGNRIALLPVPLGKPGQSPAERFHHIVRETRQVKEEVRSVPGTTLELYSILTHTTATIIEGLGLDRLPMLGNMNVSNPYGIPRRVYFNGCPVELAIPLTPIGQHQTVNITSTTYAEELHITFTAIREAFPDVQRLADYTVIALGQLEAGLAGNRRPGRRTARTEKRKRLVAKGKGLHGKTAKKKRVAANEKRLKRRISPGA